MRILDLTKLLSSTKKNYYSFNPSLLHIQGNLYLLSYRVASYLLPIQVHPWKVWDDCYKMFPDGKSVAMIKYRSDMGKAFTRRMINCELNQRLSEYDSTGLALVIKLPDGNFKMLCNVPDFFGDEMNQDARLTLCEGIITIIYNVFESDCLRKTSFFERSGVKLRCRDLTINFVEGEVVSISASEERYLFDHNYRNSEKHCCYGVTRNIIEYGIGEHLEQIINGSLKKFSNTVFDRYRAAYGSNVLFSLSTPTVEWKGKRIGCGHMKFLFKNQHIPLAHSFDWKRHGKYIYTMFLYEYEDQTVTRVSPPFIPSIGGNHAPYLLVMAISMLWIDNKLAITYGEGDCRSKVLMLNEKEIDVLLNNTSTEVSLLTKACNVAHIGYFGSRNCGDDAFETVFKWIYKDTPHHVSFYSKYAKAQPSDLYILGGGDVINPYFVKDVQKPSIAVGVGIPYESQSELLNNFSRIYLRNKNDAEKYSRIYPSLNIEYIPDLAFLLADIYPLKDRKADSIKTIGVCPTRTFWNRNYPNLYEDYCADMKIVLSQLVSKGYRIIIIPFCTPKKNSKEDDVLMANDIFVEGCEIAKIGEDNVSETFHIFSKLDFCICTRFHSHIFSTIAGVPFVSLSCSRKCIEYMKDLPGCLYRLKVNEIDIPVDFNPEHFLDFVDTKIEHHRKVATLVENLKNKNVNDIRVFISRFLRFVEEKAKDIALWVPCKSDVSSPFRGEFVTRPEQSGNPKEYEGRDPEQPTHGCENYALDYSNFEYSCVHSECSCRLVHEKTTNDSKYMHVKSVYSQPQMMFVYAQPQMMPTYVQPQMIQVAAQPQMIQMMPTYVQPQMIQVAAQPQMSTYVPVHLGQVAIPVQMSQADALSLEQERDQSQHAGKTVRCHGSEVKCRNTSLKLRSKS